jgi:hypothetical protein
MHTSPQIMDATPAIISDGVLWATTPLFAAAHLWPWHPLWAAGIWTAYAISAFFPQGEALLSKMTDSPLQYNFNPMYSQICGLKPGSVIFEVPTNSSKNQTTKVSITPTAPTSNFEHTTQPAQQDKLTSIITANATRNHTQPALVPASRWSSPSKSIDFSRFNSSTDDTTPQSNRALISHIARVPDYLWQIKRCTASAFQTRLSPTGSYAPFPTPSSCIDFLCEWVLLMVMSYKSTRLAISNSALGDLKRCYDAAWANPISPSGAYYPAPHFGRTASLCAAIEGIVMGAKFSKHRLVDCCPWYSRISGGLYQEWSWNINSWCWHILTPILLSALTMLNMFAVARWPEPRATNSRLLVGKIAAIFTIVHLQELLPWIPIVAFASLNLQPSTWLMKIKRLALKAWLVFNPMGLLAWYLVETASYRYVENCFYVMSTAVILTLARESVAPKWNALLQWLQIAPRDI